MRINDLNKGKMVNIIMENLRYLPAIDQLQREERFNAIQKRENIAFNVLTNWLIDIVDQLRQDLLVKKAPTFSNKEEVKAYIFQQLEEEIAIFHNTSQLQRVINGTGIVLHTNLGRSRLSDAAVKQLVDVARHYSTLEFDLEKGARGSRHAIVEEKICRLTGAEAAIVVNNNAAAVYFVLKALAEKKEVIVSRGELVEIGGSFRISEIMQLSDAYLKEVGTTNKTHLVDYKRAITEETGLILKVHKSNFDLVGFTAEVSTDELVQLSNSHQIPIYEDLGSGTLYDFKQRNIGKEPTVKEQVQKGIDLISFSGDKLLGGPQAGMIVGKKEYINLLKEHQLMRVLRVDKFTLASLEATLKTYLIGRETKDIPTVRDLIQPEETIYRRAEQFLKRVSGRYPAWTFTIKKSMSKVGGGTMPTEDLPTYVIEVTHEKFSAQEIADNFRRHETPIIVRVKKETVHIDFRLIEEKDLDVIIQAIQTVS